MSSRFNEALARADLAQLRVFGELEDSTFHDPNGAIEDVELPFIFSERDTAEPPHNTSAARGQYTNAWITLAKLPVQDPTGYQVVSGSDTYWIRSATADGGGGVLMKLHKVRS